MRKPTDGEEKEAESLAALEETFRAVDRARDARSKRNDARFDAKQVARLVEYFGHPATHVADNPNEATRVCASVSQARARDAEAEGTWRALKTARTVEAAEAARRAFVWAAEKWREVRQLGAGDPWDDEACAAYVTKDGGETRKSCALPAHHAGNHRTHEGLAWNDGGFPRPCGD